MRTLGLIARSDKTGLGIQTHRLARLLKPDRILLIDSTPFNGNEQHPDWYKDYNVTTIYGFPSDIDMGVFAHGVDYVLSCETFYNNNATTIIKGQKTKSVLIANPEFYDWYLPHFQYIPQPDIVIVPSLWKLQEMRSRCGAVYIPTPIFNDEFKNVAQRNTDRTGRNYLFMNGKTAAEDRNGLESLYEALAYSKGDYTITIKAQHDVRRVDDPRLIYDFSNPDNQAELYEGYDLLIQPRRYAGQSLSMTEALYCGVPVLMTDIDPNNKILPSKWLVPARRTGLLQTRFLTEVYSADPLELGKKLDTIKLDRKAKEEAAIRGTNYDAELLRAAYDEVLV